MKRPASARQHGLSLIELMVGLAITALVLAPLVPMLQTASAAARIGGDQLALEQEANFAIARISARIRASAPSQLTGLTSDWLKPAVYSLDSNGTLTEQQGKDTYVVAESVTAFSLSAPASADGQPLVQVSLTLERKDAGSNASTSASATVRMGGMQ
jgi:prepilin-type N-terminal cleavage/methylation domain-containing protein